MSISGDQDEYAQKQHQLCDYNMKPGWWCSRQKNHDSACALRTRWWNPFDWFGDVRMIAGLIRDWAGK